MMIRSASLLALIAILLLGALAPAVEAQRRSREDGRRMHHRWRSISPEERAEREAFHESTMAFFRGALGDDERARASLRVFDRMARQTAFALPLEELRRMQALPGAERVRAVAAAWRKRREAFELRGLDAAERAQLEGLEGEERRRRVVQLRTAKVLDEAIEEARRNGVLDDDEAETLRGLEPRARLEAAGGLRRRILMQVWSGELDEAERAELEELSDASFWRHPRVKALRFRGQLDPDDIERIRELDPRSWRALRDAIRAEDPATALREAGTLGDRAVESIAALDRGQRERLVRQLERFQRRRSSGFRPPREIFERLSREQRSAYFDLDDDERSAFLERALPDVDWAAQRARWQDREALREGLRGRWDLLRRMQGLDAEGARKLLRDEGFSPEDAARLAELQSRVGDAEAPRRGARGAWRREGQRPQRGRRDGR